MKGFMKSIAAAIVAFGVIAAAPVGQSPAQALGSGLAGAETKSEAVTKVHSRRWHRHHAYRHHAYRNYGYRRHYSRRYYQPYAYSPYTSYGYSSYRPYGYGYGYGHGGYGYGHGRRGGFSLRIGF
jgi:hypothetical protein